MKKLLFAVVFGLSSSLAAAAPEILSNETLGLHVTKPDGWHHLTAEANAQNLERAKLDSAEIQAAVAKFATAPVIAFTKYAEPYDDLNPSFKVNVKPAGQLAGRNAVEILRIVLPALKSAFGDMVIQEGPVETTVSGLPAAYVAVTYTLKVGEGRYPATSQLWIAPRGSYFFLIGAGTRQDEANGTRAEIREIVGSLRLDSRP